MISTSQLDLVEEAVDVLQAVVPEEDDLAFGDQLGPGDHELHYIVEMPAELKDDDGHLPLALLELPGIHVDLLEPGEVELAWRDVVAVRPEEHDGNVELLKDLDGGLRVVVGCAVEEDHGLLPPIRLELVELLHEGHEVDLHDAGVTVGLGQRHVGVAVCVDAHDHRDPRAHEDARHSIRRPTLLPLHSSEVAHPKPGLVNVEEAVAGLLELDELEGPLLAEDEVLSGVGVV